MLEILNLKPEAFGLDISDLSSKIIKLKKKRGVLTLASFGEAKINPGIIEGGEIKDEEALSKIIKEAILKTKGAKLGTKYVISSLPEEKAFLQVIQLPIMKEEELERAVLFEAENYIPISVDEVYLDFQVVQPVVDHLDHIDVLIAALPKKTVDPYFNSIKKAGLQPKAFEIESQAISRAIVKNELSPFPVLLIDFGATRTSFIIFSGYSLRFTASIPVSSQKFTEAISKTLKIDLAEAENLKIKYGIEEKIKVKLKNEKSEIEKENSEIFEALIPSFTDLAEQIKKYINYYQSHAQHEHLPPNGKAISKIILCGGGANLRGLVEFLTAELKIPTEMGNPWINILPKELREVPELPYEKSLAFTAALGLALRGIKGK
jgi:type IV pilus assembly protein PilM